MNSKTFMVLALLSLAGAIYLPFLTQNVMHLVILMAVAFVFFVIGLFAPPAKKKCTNCSAELQIVSIKDGEITTARHDWAVGNESGTSEETRQESYVYYRCPVCGKTDSEKRVSSKIRSV